MDEYNSIEDYIRDDKFSKISPDAKSYKVQIKRQSSPSNDEKEPEKKQQQEKPKSGQGDVVNGPDMTCKSTKNLGIITYLKHLLVPHRVLQRGNNSSLFVGDYRRPHSMQGIGPRHELIFST